MCLYAVEGHHGAEITASSFPHQSRLWIEYITMGTWRGLRVAFVLGSLLMILLIIVYWDDVGGFNLHPLQEPKRGSPRPRPTTAAQIGSSSSANPTAAPSTTLAPEGRGGAAEAHAVEERKEKQVQRKEETRGDAEDDREQEARKQRVMDVCSGKDAVEFPGRTRAFEQIPNRELDHLIVDDTHQIIYCYVPKVPFASVCVCVNIPNTRSRALFSFLQHLLFPVVFPSIAVLRPGGVHQLEAGDGGPVSVSDLAVLGETVH